MVQLAPFLTTQATQTQAQASAPVPAAVPGLFQALLLEALTGAQLAAMPQAAATAPAPDGAQAPFQGLPQPQLPQALPEGAIPQVPPAELPALPLRLSGPTPPAVPVEAQAQPLPAELPPALPAAAEEETEPAPEAVPAEPAPVAVTTVGPLQTPSQTPPPALTAQVAAQLVQPQAAAQPQSTQPGAAARPQTPPQAIPAADEPAVDPQLRTFVQKAVAAVQQGQDAPQRAEQQPAAKPTFGDLIKLVADADKAPQPSTPTAAAPVAEEPAAPEAPATAAPEVKLHRHEATAETGVEPAPRQPVEPEQVIRQVTRFVKVMVDSKQSEVRLNLYPEHLGHVAVKLVIGEGVLRANLVAQDMAVKAALEANLDQLKTRLSDQGFQVEQVQVTVGGDSQPHHSRQGDQQRQPHQPWHSRQGANQQTQEPRQAAQPSQQRQTLTQTWTRGTGARLNSLA